MTIISTPTERRLDPQPQLHLPSTYPFKVPFWPCLTSPANMRRNHTTSALPRRFSTAAHPLFHCPPSIGEAAQHRHSLRDSFFECKVPVGRWGFVWNNAHKESFDRMQSILGFCFSAESYNRPLIRRWCYSQLVRLTFFTHPII